MKAESLVTVVSSRRDGTKSYTFNFVIGSSGSSLAYSVYPPNDCSEGWLGSESEQHSHLTAAASPCPEEPYQVDQGIR